MSAAAPQPVLVREGFSWGALFFGWIWLLLHRAWLPALLLLAGTIVVILLTPAAARPLVAAGIAVLQGLFGNDLRRWSLERRGFAFAHVVGGARREWRAGAAAGSPPRSRGGVRAVKVAVVDYGSGNLASAARALALAAERAAIAVEVAVTSDPDTVARADRIVLPGQGASPTAREGSPPSPACATRSRLDRGRHAVLRHLRRHAADGRARPRARDHAGLRLGRRRNRADGPAGPAPAADGLERAALRPRRAPPCDGRSGAGRPRLFRP